MVWPVILSTITGGIGKAITDWISYKATESKNKQEIRLAELVAHKEQAIAEAKADTDQLRSRINATSKEFKQTTFWLLLVPIAYSMFFPKRAAEMWHNFSLMPDLFQYLFYAVYSAIWGLPVMKSGYQTFTELRSSTRQYKIEKIKALNETAIAKSLRETIFKGGMTQEQWDAIKLAIEKGHE